MRISLLLLTTGLVLGTSSVAIASDDARALDPRITQNQVENALSLIQLRREGQRIFSTPFNRADGFGDGPINPLDKVSPGGRPTFRNHGSLLRMNGIDSQTCLECHNYRTTDTIPFEFAVGGVGAAGAAIPTRVGPHPGLDVRQAPRRRRRGGAGGAAGGGGFGGCAGGSAG